MEQSTSAPPGRRRHSRRVLSGGASLQFGEAPARPVRSRDISRSGIALLSATDLKRGTLATVSVQLPSPAARPVLVVVRARVARSVYSPQDSGFTLGLEFLPLAPEGLATILRYVED